MIWKEKVGHIEKKTFRALVGKHEGHHFGNQGIDGRIILHLFLQEMK